MNQIFITSGSTSLTGDNSQAKDVIIAGYAVQGFLGVRPSGQVVLHQQDQAKDCILSEIQFKYCRD